MGEPLEEVEDADPVRLLFANISAAIIERKFSLLVTRLASSFSLLFGMALLLDIISGGLCGHDSAFFCKSDLDVLTVSLYHLPNFFIPV